MYELAVESYGDLYVGFFSTLTTIQDCNIQLRTIFEYSRSGRRLHLKGFSCPLIPRQELGRRQRTYRGNKSLLSIF
jgi:hypothetical protein